MPQCCDIAHTWFIDRLILTQRRRWWWYHGGDGKVSGEDASEDDGDGVGDGDQQMLIKRIDAEKILSYGRL